jgi:hypothetical protein
MHFKNDRGTENGAYAWKMTTLRVMAVSRSKVSFDQMATPVPESMDTGHILLTDDIQDHY